MKNLLLLAFVAAAVIATVFIRTSGTSKDAKPVGSRAVDGGAAIAASEGPGVLDPAASRSTPDNVDGRSGTADPPEHGGGDAPRAHALDPSGLTQDEKIEYLLNAYEFYANWSQSDDPAARASAAHMLAKECVTAILRENGRADYVPDTETPHGPAFQLQPKHDDEYVIVAARAKFTFRRGEFPAYDMARERMIAAKSKPSEHLSALTQEQSALLEDLNQRALLVLGVEDASDD